MLFNKLTVQFFKTDHEQTAFCLCIPSTFILTETTSFLHGHILLYSSSSWNWRMASNVVSGIHLPCEFSDTTSIPEFGDFFNFTIFYEALSCWAVFCTGGNHVAPETFTCNWLIRTFKAGPLGYLLISCFPDNGEMSKALATFVVIPFSSFLIVHLEYDTRSWTLTLNPRLHS